MICVTREMPKWREKKLSVKITEFCFNPRNSRCWNVLRKPIVTYGKCSKPTLVWPRFLFLPMTVDWEEGHQLMPLWLPPSDPRSVGKIIPHRAHLVQLWTKMVKRRLLPPNLDSIIYRHHQHHILQHQVLSQEAEVWSEERRKKWTKLKIRILNQKIVQYPDQHSNFISENIWTPTRRSSSTIIIDVNLTHDRAYDLTRLNVTPIISNFY